MVIGEGAVEIGGLLGHETAVLDRVGKTDGGVGAGVVEEPALGGLDEVEAEESGGAGAVGFQVQARAAVVGVGEDELGRDDVLVEGLLTAVEIDEEGVYEVGALAEGGFELGPFGGLDD